MPTVDVRTLELGEMIATLSIDGSAIGPLHELHYVWITVQTPRDDELVDFRFEVIEDRFMLKPDSYVEAIEEIEATCRLASRIDLQWLATMISQPLPGIGRVLPNVISIGDSIEVGAHPSYGLSGSTHDVVLGAVQRIRLCM